MFLPVHVLAYFLSSYYSDDVTPTISRNLETKDIFRTASDMGGTAAYEMSPGTEIEPLQQKTK